MELKATEPNCGLLCLLLRPQLFHPADPTLRRGESFVNRRRPGYNRQTSYSQDCFYVPTPNDQDDKKVEIFTRKTFFAAVMMMGKTG